MYVVYKVYITAIIIGEAKLQLKSYKYMQWRSYRGAGGAVALPDSILALKKYAFS